jgi:hypothetical protein
MSIRSIVSLAVCATLPALGACSDSHSTSPADTSNADATVRLVNATDAALDFRQGNSVVDGGDNLAFGTGTPCTKVSAPDPQLTVTPAGIKSNLAGFDPSFDPGRSYTIVAFPGGGSATSFAMLLNAFQPTSSTAGFRVLNATRDPTALDAFVTNPGAALLTRTTGNTVAGTASAFVGVAAGMRQIRLTPAGSHTVVFDAGAIRLNAGTSYTIIVAPAAAGKSALRAILVSGC